jgi:hypothetical protein
MKKDHRRLGYDIPAKKQRGMSFYALAVSVFAFVLSIAFGAFAAAVSYQRYQQSLDALVSLADQSDNLTGALTAVDRHIRNDLGFPTRIKEHAGIFVVEFTEKLKDAQPDAAEKNSSDSLSAKSLIVEGGKKFSEECRDSIKFDRLRVCRRIPLSSQVEQAKKSSKKLNPS